MNYTYQGKAVQVIQFDCVMSQFNRFGEREESVEHVALCAADDGSLNSIPANELRTDLKPAVKKPAANSTKVPAAKSTKAS